MAKLPKVVNAHKKQSSGQASHNLKGILLENAEELLKQYIQSALGKGEMQSHNREARSEVWGLVKHVILNASDILDIDVNSPEAIIGAVARGQCTADEARQLLKLYRQVSDINTQEKGAALASSGGSGSLNITIMTNTKDEQPQPIDITPKMEHKND